MKMTQKDLLFENKRNELLIDMIKYEGWGSAAEMIGGVENLKRVTGIETPMDFLNIFNDLEVVQSKKEEHLTLFRYETGNNIMAYNRKNDHIYMNYYSIWSFLNDGFGLNYGEIQKLTQEWLSETYNLRGVTTGIELTVQKFC